MAFSEYGDPNGEPVLFCHGWPSSRTMAQLTDEAAQKLGVRIISPDRPGISDSSFEAGRTLLDWPTAVRALAGASADRPECGCSRSLVARPTPMSRPGRCRSRWKRSRLSAARRRLPNCGIAPGCSGSIAGCSRSMRGSRNCCGCMFPSRSTVRLGEDAAPLPALGAPQRCNAATRRCCAIRKPLKPVSKAHGKPGAPRPKGVMRMPRSTRSPGDFRWRKCKCRCACGTGRRIALSPFGSPRNSRRVCRIVELHLVENAGHYSLPIRHIAAKFSPISSRSRVAAKRAMPHFSRA